MSSVPRDTKLAVLMAILEFRSRNRFGPTVEEIRDAIGVNARSTVQFHINDLVDEGYLSQVPGKRRTLKVTKKGAMLIEILSDVEAV
jgi:predicted transcriptional regulator